MNLRKLFAVISVAGIVNGCAHLEPFADRATAFNEEVAKTQNRTLMLNVLRATYRYPMHFTELSTLSGTETVTGNAGLSIPFSHIYGSGDMRVGSLSTSVSQSPTFNVAVLETQEFYKGMLAQLSVDQLSGYLAEGIPRELIFMLAFSSFRFQPSTADMPVTVSNNFHEVGGNSPEANYCRGRQYESQCFHDILRALEDRGLTIEPSKDASNVGAPLDVKRLANLKELQLVSAGGLQITAFDLADCDAGASACLDGTGFDSETQHRLLNGETLYRVQKITKESRFCFDAPVNTRDESGSDPTGPVNTYGPDSIAHLVEAQTIPVQLICANRLKPKDKPSRQDLLSLAKCTTTFMGTKEKKNFSPPSDCPPGASPRESALTLLALSLSRAESAGHASVKSSFPAVEMRSTEGVIYYLGEIARCETLGASCPTPMARIEDLNGSEKPLFCVARNGSTSGDCKAAYTANATRITVGFESAKYEVPMDPQGSDRSGQVLRVVTQLVALNRSAKDFPVPAVIPLISR